MLEILADRARRLSVIAGFLLVASWSGVTTAVPGPPLVPVVEQGSSGLATFTSPNGLKGVVDPRPGTRTVFLEIAVRVGSRDEPEGRAGIAHLLEHLFFKEGHAAQTGGHARSNPAFSALRAVGAEINASTDF